MSKVLLGLIDGRLDPLDPALLSADGQRYRWRALWDQGSDEVNNFWDRPPGNGVASGRLLDVNQVSPNKWPSRALGLQALGLDDPAGSGSAARQHGSLVARLLAGATDPVTGQRDAAAHCDVAAVMLPARQLTEAHGQWLPVAVLTGLRFLLAQRREGEVLVVNLSVTGGVGLRGRGMLTDAVNALIESEAGRLVVVIAAGNERRHGGHLAGTLAPNQTAEFHMFLPASRAQSTLLEWQAEAVDGTAEAKLRWHALSPSRQDSIPLAPGRGQRLRGRAPPTPSGDAMCWLAQQGQTETNRDRARGVWAASPTVAAEAQALAGRWTFTLHNAGTAPVQWDAWLARNDQPGLDKIPPVRFDGPTSRADTLTVLARAEAAIRVGGYLPRGPGRAALYPDGGSGGRTGAGPDVLGLAELRTQPNADSGGAASPQPRRGTSIAAPFVARRLANALLAARHVPTTKAECLALLQRQQPFVLLSGDDTPEERDAAWCVQV